MVRIVLMRGTSTWPQRRRRPDLRPLTQPLLTIPANGRHGHGVAGLDAGVATGVGAGGRAPTFAQLGARMAEH